MSQLLLFCCSDSTHGETTSAEDCAQDVTAEHHTSDDGMLGAVGKAEMLPCVCCAFDKLCCPEGPREKRGVSYPSFPWRDILT